MVQEMEFDSFNGGEDSQHKCVGLVALSKTFAMQDDFFFMEQHHLAEITNRCTCPRSFHIHSVECDMSMEMHTAPPLHYLDATENSTSAGLGFNHLSTPPHDTEHVFPTDNLRHFFHNSSGGNCPVFIPPSLVYKQHGIWKERGKFQTPVIGVYRADLQAELLLSSANHYLQYTEILLSMAVCTGLHLLQKYILLNGSVPQEKFPLHRKYLRYLHKTSTIEFNIISAAKQTRVQSSVASTHITEVSLSGCVIYFLLVTTHAGQEKNKYRILPI